MTGERKPWQQQVGESSKLYRYFCAYMNAMPGERSCPKVAKRLGLSAVTLTKASQKYGWQARVGAWDQEIARRMAASTEDAVVEMRKRHIQIGVGLQTAGVKELQALVNKVNAAAAGAQALAIKEGRDPSLAFHEPVLSPLDTLRLLQSGIEIERLTRGLVTARVADGDDDAGLEKLTLEELKTLKALKAKLA